MVGADGDDVAQQTTGASYRHPDHAVSEPTRYEVGESFVGQGVNAAHLNTVLGDRNGPAGTAWATALGSPSAGHVPFVAVLRPSLPVKPLTLFVSKAAPASESHGTHIWGPAQAGVAGGVADALAEGVIAPEHADTHVLIAAVWVNPGADDADAVYRNNREATVNALRNGASQAPALDAVLAARASVSNPFYTAPLMPSAPEPAPPAQPGGPRA